MKNLQNKILSQGQTLIELLVAMTLIVLVVTSVLMMTSRSVQNATVSKMREKAVVLSRTHLESLRRARHNQTWSEFDSYLSSIAVENDGDFMINVATANLVPDNPNVIPVILTVSWDDPKGSHSIQNKTIFHQNN